MVMSVSDQRLMVLLFRILQGERPYWWVRETTAFDNPPELTHYPLTCETGPGIRLLCKSVCVPIT